jgi:hypothetical protein
VNINGLQKRRAFATRSFSLCAPKGILSTLQKHCSQPPRAMLLEAKNNAFGSQE